MTALERLREWFNGDKRPEKSAWITGDTVETRALLELADRLEKLEQDCGAMAALRRYKFDPNLPPIAPLPMPSATESPPVPFRGIIVPGKYRMRNGGQAGVERNDESEQDRWPWIGQFNGVLELWNADGTYIDPHHPHEKDIIAGPLAGEPQQKPDTALLIAEMLHVVKGVRPLVLRGTTETLTEEEAIRTTWLGHLDAAITKASAIVKPEPKRETRKVWVNFYRNRDDHSIWPSRSAAGDVATSERIACVEADITFTHGQGLVAGE